MPELRVDLQHARAPLLAAAFDCAAGELLALVGPSGSGKTSLLRAVAGLLGARALRGSVSLGTQTWFDSQRGINLRPQQRRVGLVFQQYALFPHLNATANAVIGAGPGADAGATTQAQELLQRLGLDRAMARRRPAQLSGGQQQRVALARALMRVTPAAADRAAGHGVLLLDEPFSAVDAPTRQWLYRELASLRQDFSTPMVLVTHDLAEARRLADRVVIVDAGVSLQSGPPQQVFASPRNARVAELVGIQNHFQGRFHRQAGGRGRLDWGGECEVRPVGLQVIDKNRLVDGIAVTWVLAGESVDVSLPGAGRDGAAAAACVNPVPCTLTELLALGETSLCTLVPQQLPSQRLTLNLSTALLRAMGATVGAALQVSIPPTGIHIMPVRQQKAG